ncbi:MAG: pantetheine-phosphate adenylyltransferase [Parachlamydiaceae bacterium]|nr:pantetheine-phosphate adenylyltransferase [Parachlamydiaceae bacterium]
MKKVIFPGTFDPPTLGHFDIAKRASQIFDYVYIAIGSNTLKNSPFFSLEKRVEYLKTITKTIPNIEVTTFSGVLVDFAEKLGVNAILKSLRSASDFDYENVQAQMNRHLANVETIYMVADERYRFISSSLIREIASHGKRIDAFISPEIAEDVFHGLSKQK